MLIRGNQGLVNGSQVRSPTSNLLQLLSTLENPVVRKNKQLSSNIRGDYVSAIASLEPSIRAIYFRQRISALGV